MVKMKKRFSRTPKNYDGTGATGKDIRDLFGLVLENLNVSDFAQKEEVFKAWFAIIGTNFELLAVPISLENGVLAIQVKSSILHDRLRNVERPKLLQQMQERFSKTVVQNIIFRIG